MVHVAREMILRLTDVQILRIPHVLAPHIIYFLMMTGYGAMQILLLALGPVKESIMGP